MLRRIGSISIALSMLLLSLLFLPRQAVFALTATMTATPCAGSLTITGKVYDTSTMAGIAGATVIANTSVSHPFAATTASDGTYTLSIPSASNYSCLVTGMVVNASGYHEYSISVRSQQLFSQPVRDFGLTQLTTPVTPSSTPTIGCGSIVVATSTFTRTPAPVATNTPTRTPTIFSPPCGPTYITPTQNITATPTPTRTNTIGCTSVIVVTATPSPTHTPTPRTATATNTACGPIYVIASNTPTPSPTGSVTATGGPDLIISSITYVGSTPACMNQPKDSVVVSNVGTASAGTFQVGFSRNGVAEPAQTVSGLAAGQSVTLLFTAGGTVTATADSTNTVAENIESNNSLTVSLPVPTQAFTCTPTFTPPPVATTLTPTPSRTPTVTFTPSITPTQNTSVVCSPVNATITAPFTKDGVGTFCWQSSNLGGYINSWNMTSVTINKVNITNVYVPASSYPAKSGGFWYVTYNGPYSWSHFEAK